MAPPNQFYDYMKKECMAHARDFMNDVPPDQDELTANMWANRAKA